MKKMRTVSLAVTIVMITLIIAVWTGTAQATAEEDMFTATTQPDALILLDLSGSMCCKHHGLRRRKQHLPLRIQRSRHRRSRQLHRRAGPFQLPI
jgi:hypothetical protein